MSNSAGISNMIDRYCGTTSRGSGFITATNLNCDTLHLLLGLLKYEKVLRLFSRNFFK